MLSTSDVCVSYNVVERLNITAALFKDVEDKTGNLEMGSLVMAVIELKAKSQSGLIYVANKWSVS